MAQASMASIPGLKETYIQLKTRMEKAVEDFRKAMAATRTGRASVHMLDSVSVDYYGSQMPINQIAQVHAPEPQMITVQPFDPSSLGAIEKAIRSAELGLNPMNDGKLIQERRQEMVKHLNKALEEHRTAVRNIRRDGNDAIKKAMKDKKITEDDEKRSLEEIQKLTDDEIKKMEEMSKAKEKEVLEIK
jgi:ribosome recycling factor